jgi:hypothetical protein
VHGIITTPASARQDHTNILCLRRGRSHRPVVRIIPDGALYRIEWPDTGLSGLVNLSRAKAAALEWAESAKP